MNILPNPISPPLVSVGRDELIELADRCAPRQGYNSTSLTSVRILRSETELQDIPVLYNPGAVFVLQGSKQGLLDEKVYLYDEEHYLAVSVPVPFRMHSMASPARPLLAVYIEFDMSMAAGIAMQVARFAGAGNDKARSLISSRISSEIEDVLLRLLRALRNPAETAILGASLLRELHYRVMIGPQGGAMLAALQQKGPSGRVIQSLNWLRKNYASKILIAELAKEAGMSVPSYHVHFRELTGSSPIQYLKAMRLHEARLLLASQTRTIAEVATSVGYMSPAQFSRDFKRYFGRTASEEMRWLLRHLGGAGQASA